MDPIMTALQDALKAATDAGDIEAVAAISALMKKRQAAAPTPDASPTDPTAAAPASGDPVQADDTAPPAPEGAAPPYDDAQDATTASTVPPALMDAITAEYPNAEIDDYQPAAPEGPFVVVGVPDGNTLTYWRVPFSISETGEYALGTAEEVQLVPDDTTSDPSAAPADPSASITARMTLTALGDTPPTEYRLWAFGPVDTSKGTFQFTRGDAERVMMEYTEHGNELHFDYEHGTFDATPGQPAPAAAWMNLELRDDGLYLTNIRWTDRAASMIKAREYRYLSPAFEVDERGHICRLLNVALTNLPATKRLEPLVAASTRITALERANAEKDAEIRRLRHETFTRERDATLARLEAAGVPPAIIARARPLLDADETASPTVTLTRAGKTVNVRPGEHAAALLLELATAKPVPLGERTGRTADQSGVTLEAAAREVETEWVKAGRHHPRRKDVLVEARRRYPHLRGE